MNNYTEYRYEKKFVYPCPHFFENLIKHHPAMFSEVFNERLVNNIYLDSDFINYKEHIDGISERLKVRIRWYGKKYNNPILEFKIKSNEVNRKLSFPLDSKLPMWVVEKLRFLQPSLVNSYKRRYFLSANGNFRITLDKDLILGKIKQPFCVLEVKYSIIDETQNITQFFPLRVQAYSKYIKGVEE